MVLLSRRHVLIATAGAALSSCTTKAPARPTPVDPDVALTAAAVARERQLIASYDEALLRRPDLAALLRPLRDEHQTHLDRLTPPASSPSPTPTITAPTPTPTAATRTADPRPALAAQERGAAAAHAAGTRGSSRRLAQVLGSLAAAEASHVLVL